MGAIGTPAFNQSSRSDHAGRRSWQGRASAKCSPRQMAPAAPEPPWLRLMAERSEKRSHIPSTSNNQRAPAAACPTNAFYPLASWCRRHTHSQYFKQSAPPRPHLAHPTPFTPWQGPWPLPVLQIILQHPSWQVSPLQHPDNPPNLNKPLPRRRSSRALSRDPQSPGPPGPYTRATSPS